MHKLIINISFKHRKTQDTCWDEECVSLLDRALVAHVHLITKEHLILIGRGAPALKQGQVGRGGTDQVEELLTLKETSFQTIPLQHIEQSLYSLSLK